MENAIPALVIGAILLIASSFVARGSLQTYDQLGAGIKSRALIVKDRKLNRSLGLGPQKLQQPFGDRKRNQARDDRKGRISAGHEVNRKATFTQNSVGVIEKGLHIADMLEQGPRDNQSKLTILEGQAFTDISNSCLLCFLVGLQFLLRDINGNHAHVLRSIQKLVKGAGTAAANVSDYRFRCTLEALDNSSVITPVQVLSSVRDFPFNARGDTPVEVDEPADWIRPGTSGWREDSRPALISHA